MGNVIGFIMLALTFGLMCLLIGLRIGWRQKRPEHMTDDQVYFFISAMFARGLTFYDSQHRMDTLPDRVRSALRAARLF